MGAALSKLSAVAVHHHIAVVCVFRPLSALRQGDATGGACAAALEPFGDVADRVGWIAPDGGLGLSRADVLKNRHGCRTSVPLDVDPASGRLVAR